MTQGSARFARSAFFFRALILPLPKQSSRFKALSQVLGRPVLNKLLLNKQVYQPNHQILRSASVVAPYRPASIPY
ncbi:hypothetical protein SE17_12815 [Kouleothrix aurantiaca]|uniref:Uncharacterized protein n=1 Tax=Kouleothrix aurantiaca TaxID=186479 RepID=A0A0P9DAW9_9CHLR|nr:hypothetical protein SE17_12815 [Kouleothrix aurantiaca]